MDVRGAYVQATRISDPKASGTYSSIFVFENQP